MENNGKIWGLGFLGMNYCCQHQLPVRQQWFSVGIFPLGPFFGLTGNRKIHRNGMHGVSTDTDAKGREADAKRREASRLYHV